MKFIKIFSCFLLVAVLCISNSLIVFAKSLELTDRDKQYLKKYYIVYTNSDNLRRIVTSDEEFYIYIDDKDFVFSSSKLSLCGTHNNSKLVYYDEYYSSDNFNNLKLSYSDNSNYISNFDIKHYKSETNFDVIFYKSVNYFNVDLSDALGMLRVIVFHDNVTTIVSVCIFIMMSFISIKLIKRIIFTFVR